MHKIQAMGVFQFSADSNGLVAFSLQDLSVTLKQTDLPESVFLAEEN